MLNYQRVTAEEDTMPFEALIFTVVALILCQLIGCVQLGIACGLSQADGSGCSTLGEVRGLSLAAEWFQ